MTPTTLIVAGAVLLLTVGLGTVVHELLHAAVLRASGVGYELRWLHGGRSGRLGAGLFGTWASVELRTVPADLSPWRLRAASLAPLLLATPFLAVAAGAVPDPFAIGGVPLQVAAVGWLACSLPSPQDFSLVWHAEAVLDGDVLPVEERL
jgi:hypothetical protein